MTECNSYYMIITNEFDYECDLRNEFRFIGFPYRNRNSVKAMKSGDRIIFYISKKSVFAAVVEVTGDHFYSEKRIWSDPYDLWPYRINTKPIVFLDDISKGVYIKDIWDNLLFIKNKKKWGSQVQGSYRKLTQNDFNVIQKAIEERTK